MSYVHYTKRKFKNMKNIKMIKSTNYYKHNLINVILLFDHMLMNSLLHINLLLIIKKHDELIKVEASNNIARP
jgi:hypothetical protein